MTTRSNTGRFEAETSANISLRCLSTCYMSSTAKGVQVERYEDLEGEDIYAVPDNRVAEFLATGNFEVA